MHVASMLSRAPRLTPATRTPGACRDRARRRLARRHVFA